MAAVAVVWVVAQWVAVPLWAPLGLDESVYYSQLAPNVPAAWLGPHRAWGVPLLAAPVTSVTTSMIVLRVYLGLCAGVGLMMAFGVWLRLRPGAAVPLAAGLFASLWLSVYYGSALMPNLPAALAAVAGVGLFLRAQQVRASDAATCNAYVSERAAGKQWQRVRITAGLVVAFAALSLLRPTEAVPVAIVVAVAAALWRPWRRLAPVAAVAAGTMVGWGAWIVEAEVRFGGLGSRLAQVKALGESGLQNNILRQLQVFGAPRLGCHQSSPVCGPVTPAALLAWTMLPLLVAVGLCAAGRLPSARHRTQPRHGQALDSVAERWIRYRAGLTLAALVAGCGAVPYLFYTGLATPRYLLVTYALLAIPAAEGIIWLASRHRHGWIAPGVVVLVFATQQFIVASDVGHDGLRHRKLPVHIAARLTRLGVHQPCFIYGYRSWQIAVAMRCASLGDHMLATTQPDPATHRATLIRQARDGIDVVALSPLPANPAMPAGWRAYQISRRPLFYAYLPPARPRH